MTNNFGLGRGLASLIPQKKANSSEKDKKIKDSRDDISQKGENPFLRGSKENTAGEKPGNIEEIDIIRVAPNPHQPRKNFSPEKLQELADSIKQHGILQPIVVSKSGNQYELIMGERRLQAAKLAGLAKISAIVREATNQQKLEMAVIENIQRHDLNPVEEAKSYAKLVQEFGLKQEEVADKVGKSRSAIANKLRLLGLPVEIQRALAEGKITEGHAKAILAVENAEKQRALFDLIIKNNLTVRQTENKTKEISVRTHTRTISIDSEIKKIEDDLTAKFGTKVKLSKSGSGGKIVIEYYSKEELTNLISKIC
ncbi:MAG: ParB/RepB/Spo0J family partition protein [Patescibacteria group bacterium]